MTNSSLLMVEQYKLNREREREREERERRERRERERRERRELRRWIKLQTLNAMPRKHITSIPTCLSGIIMDQD